MVYLDSHSSGCIHWVLVDSKPRKDGFAIYTLITNFNLPKKKKTQVETKIFAITEKSFYTCLL